jgi:hypothetical protein
MFIGKHLLLPALFLSFKTLLIHYKHDNRIYKCAHMEPKNIIGPADSKINIEEVI